jgi:hypothetical protein
MTNAKRRPPVTLLDRSVRHRRVTKLFALVRAAIHRPKRRSRMTPPDLRARTASGPTGKRQDEPVCARRNLLGESKSPGTGV